MASRPEITRWQASGCAGQGGLTFNGLPYPLNAQSCTRATGLTRGTITGIRIALSSPGCGATVGRRYRRLARRVSFAYKNRTSVLTIGPKGNLHFWTVSGCLGLISNGDPATLTASYPITPKQTLTSP